MERGLKSEGLTREEDQALIQKKESYDHLDESEKENQGQALPYSALISAPFAGTVNYPSFNNNTGNYSQAGFFQKAYGNIASLRLNRKAIQAKLKIGQPNDKYEQEADRVAEQVMRMPDRSCIECKEEERPGEKITRHNKEGTNLLQRQEKEESLEEEKGIEEEEIPEEEEEEIPEEESLLQPKPISSEPYLIQRQLEDERGGEGGEKEEEEEKINEPLEGSDEEEYIQSKLKTGKPRDVYEQEAEPVAERVMSMPMHIGTAIRPSITHLHQVIQSPGSGSLVSATVRKKLEPVLGADLSHVKVHNDTKANEAAESIQAKAFTHKNNIWLGAGQNPHDESLMAHELTHVVQQKKLWNPHHSFMPTSTRLQKKGSSPSRNWVKRKNR